VTEPLLVCRDLTKRYGGLTAVTNVCLELHKGELVGLIGPNGAGKTTCFNLITGADAPTSGRIRFLGHDVTNTCDYRMARLGVARTFQNIRLWRDMSALDNVRAVCRGGSDYGLLAGILRLPSFHRGEREATNEALSLLRLLDLEPRAEERAGDLSYGEQRKLEIARALALRPKLLLLDEPAAGMNPAEKAELMRTVRSIRAEFDLTILLIEHDMKFVMGICERIYVLDHGEEIAHGPPDAIRSDPRVIEAYLGEQA
jgi:branched-chain amino acid transport system ATP-binding protein